MDYKKKKNWLIVYIYNYYSLLSAVFPPFKMTSFPLRVSHFPFALLTHTLHALYIHIYIYTHTSLSSDLYSLSSFILMCLNWYALIIQGTMSSPLFLSLFLLVLTQTQAQTRTPDPAPAPASDACNGIFLSYTYTDGKAVPPILKSNPARQAYRFESSLFILNNDLEELKSWRVFVGFQHDEYLVSASNAVLADGNSFPGSVGNGSVFAGYPNPDLKTGVETAGDLTQMSARVDLVGTQFGVGPRSVPMPTNISLVNDGWVCPRPASKGTLTHTLTMGLIFLKYWIWRAFRRFDLY